ncbi:hypothetical protein [Candidatus Villigracilis affinis]|uniref:hypothetical protein n=1 Tax=Candidatus Villigracilis affinis TaxID=3140682 RepID=UPI002A1C5B2F|nr:hypothetical protein [Anaerolineales bacterium]
MKKLLLVISIFLLTACGANPTAPTTAEASVTEVSASAAPTEEPVIEPSSPVLFKIVKADGSTFDVTLEAVKSLPLARVQAEGKMEEGPYLADILALAGVTEFVEVTLTGSSNPATLTFEQVDNNTILDFNNHGTMKLATTYIAKAAWTKDVAEITVK